MIAGLRDLWRRIFGEPFPLNNRALEQALEAGGEALAGGLHTVRLDPKFKIVAAREAGRVVTFCSLIHHYSWSRGDLLLILYPQGHSTRYRIDRILRQGGMEFVDCSFAPRGG